MNLKRRISALLLVLVMCLSMVAVPAYAYGNDPDPDYEIVVPTEAPPAETQAATEPQNNSQTETEPTYSEIVPGVSFANDGNVTTRDLLYDEATNKQFISIETKNGAIFYIVIDYDKPVDEDSNLYETYFLNLVDEADLMALLETEETPVTCSCTQRCAVGQINMYCEICATSMVDCVGTEPETDPTVPETEPPVEEEESSGAAVLAVLLFVAMIGAFAFYYLKMRKPKPKTKGDTDLDEYNYGMDEDEEYGTKLNIGRVLSPTLALLVQREAEIATFVPEKHYTVNLEFAEFTASSIKFPCKANAQSALKKAREGTAVVKSIIVEDKQEKPPALYDLTTLQRDANRILGFTAQQTLDYAQSLYEKKLCTYPRTDSRYLTDDMLESVEAAVFSAAAVLKMEYPEIVNKEQICNSKRVTDHHAIVPTQTVIDFDLSSLPSGEQKLLSLIARQTLIAVSDPYQYQDAEITISCSDIIFTSKLRKIVNAGWKKYASNGSKQKWFSGLRVGQKLIPESESIKEGNTQPPHHYTEDLLLSAMESAGSKDTPEDAVRKGLGTPATRAGILEKLVSTGFVERTKAKKQTHLVPTAIGKSLVTVLPEELQSPELTAEWEHNLSKVQQGTLAADYFMDGITELVTDLIATYEPVAGSEILFPAATATVGKCPRCGSKVIDRAKGYLCENRDCSFGLWKNNRFFSAKKKVLTKEIAAEFLVNSQSMLTGCHSSKTGKIYNALAVMEDDGEHTEFRLVFNNE